MTRQLTDTAVVSIEPLSVLRRGVLTQGAQEESRQGGGEPVATCAVPARRDRVGECSHHWIIEAALLPLSKGVCRACGEERLFRNQLSWEEITPVKAATTGDRINGSPNPPQQREYHPFLLPRSRCG